MRILHTSDFHIGKRLYSCERREEQQAVLKELSDVCRRENIDVVLVAGDLFDNFNPSVASMSLLYDSLCDIADGGKRPVILIATILWVKYSSSSFEPTVTTSPTSSSSNSAFFEKTRSPRCKVSAMLSLVTAYPFAPERRLKATKPTEITVIIARILNKTLPTFGFTLSFFMQPCR